MFEALYPNFLHIPGPLPRSSEKLGNRMEKGSTFPQLPNTTLLQRMIINLCSSFRILACPPYR